MPVPDQRGQRVLERDYSRRRRLPIVTRHLRGRGAEPVHHRLGARRGRQAVVVRGERAQGARGPARDGSPGRRAVHRPPASGHAGPHQEEDPGGRLPQGDRAPRLRPLASGGRASCSTAPPPSPCRPSRACSHITPSCPCSPTPTPRRSPAPPPPPPPATLPRPTPHL